MRNLDWNEGAPDELMPGMVIQWPGGFIAIVGHIDTEFCQEPPRQADIQERISKIERWAYLIQPYQLEWLESMNKQHGKGET